MTEPGFNVFNFKDQKIRTLHLGWIAFFITFFMTLILVVDQMGFS